MTNDDEDRPIDRKANTEEQPGRDLRPDLDHFNDFKEGAASIRSKIPPLPFPAVSPVGVVMATLYAFVVTGGLLVGYGATSIATFHGGVYVGLIVAGVFVFAYGYVGLQAVAAATGGGE